MDQVLELNASDLSHNCTAPVHRQHSGPIPSVCDTSKQLPLSLGSLPAKQRVPSAQHDTRYYYHSEVCVPFTPSFFPIPVGRPSLSLSLSFAAGVPLATHTHLSARPGVGWVLRQPLCVRISLTQARGLRWCGGHRQRAGIYPYYSTLSLSLSLSRRDEDRHTARGAPLFLRACLHLSRVEGHCFRPAWDSHFQQRCQTPRSTRIGGFRIRSQLQAGIPTGPGQGHIW